MSAEGGGAWRPENGNQNRADPASRHVVYRDRRSCKKNISTQCRALQEGDWWRGGFAASDRPKGGDAVRSIGGV
jgi:hypothetical protein